MSKLPTDRQVLRCVFEMYKSAYPGPSAADGRGSNDPYVPIDIRAVAAKLGCKPELIFGRLYYHLDAKHRYKQENGALVALFDLNFQNNGHAVHFPYLASILAGLEEEHRKLFWSMVFSMTALILSVISIAVNILTKMAALMTPNRALHRTLNQRRFACWFRAGEGGRSASLNLLCILDNP